MKENMHFTVYRAPQVETRIWADLRTVRERLTDQFPDLVALTLVGSFGQGEGAVLIEDERITPVNDYDFVMVVEKPCDLSHVNEIRRELAKRIEISWVDISVYTVAQLRKLRYTMYHYNLRYGSQVIYGDPAVLSVIPPMDPRKMPLVEAEIQFYTRLWCFLGPFSVQILNQEPTDEQKFFLANQLSKALLACSDGLLILKSLYHHSYAERFRRFEAAFRHRTDLLPLIREATEFKLRPTRDIDYDTVERWFLVRRVFLDTMCDFVSQMYSRRFLDWGAYAGHYRSNPKQLLRRLKHLVLRRNLRYERRISVRLAQLFLLAAFDLRQVDSDLFDLAKRELGKVTGTDQSGLDWDVARAMAAELRMEI